MIMRKNSHQAIKKSTIFLAVVVMFLFGISTSSYAITIGYSSPNFDDNFQTVLRNTAKKYAESLGHSIQIEDAREDVGTQISQIQNFIASGVDAIVLAVVSAESSPQITKLAAKAGVALVYINRMPTDLASLGDKAVFVGSDEKWSGTLEAFELCKLAGGQGNAVMLVGLLSNEAAVTRSQDVREVFGGLSMCKGIKLVDEQVAEWQRTKANDIVTNWISSGIKFNIVAANNDEMAIGAIQALKAAGISMDDVFVGGIDATADAKAAMKAGDLDVTVFQDAAGQAKGGIDAAIKLSKGQKLPKFVVIPYELVTPENLKNYMDAK
jgi:ABC-type sugar transport system substrate-binding protein